ncbi:MAG: hypothetical protein HKN22_03800 [Bacteroidia bacterium]|nr:hypothetical protein [Bacteroidia bacterium]
MKLIRVLVIVLISSIAMPVVAQDELMDILSEETKGDEPKYVVATFKTTRIINSQSIETVGDNTLDFRVAHRFGAIGKKSGGDVHNLYGFDISSDIRIAFEYGITDRLTVGASRSKYKENLEGLIKYRALSQRSDNKMPVSITWFSSITYTPEKDNGRGIYEETNPLTNRVTKLYERRVNYTHQALIGRKFSSAISFQLMPTFVHRNYVDDPLDENNLFFLGAGGRVKVTPSTAVIVDYYYTFSEYRNDSDLYADPLGIGVEIETGGHVFSLMFTNSGPIVEPEFLTNTINSWEDGGYRFSFNISRNFKL